MGMAVDGLKDGMGKLQNAIKRVSENWNDVVAQGIQTAHINMIISTCNSFNGEMGALGFQIDGDLEQLDELAR